MPEMVRARISGLFAYTWIGGVALLTLLGLPTLLISTIKGGESSPGWLFSILWLGMLAWFWNVILVWISYEIRLSPTGEIEFKSVLRSVKTDAREITSVGSAMRGLDPYTVVFKFRTRRARAVRTMDGFHALIEELRKLNPEIRLRGL